MSGDRHGNGDEPVVLVVDDEPQLLRLYERYLTDRFDVRIADSGAAAIEALDESVAVVLLDRRMPEMSGDELLDEIRSNGYDGLVTMVTAVEPDVDIVDMGFDDYLVKPVNRGQLLDHVDSLLRRGSYDEAVREHFAVASKVAALEADRPEEALENEPAYRELTERLDASRERAKDTLDELTADEADALFRGLDTD